MNVFFVFKSNTGMELVTPKLDGTIIPGVTRQSVLDLASKRNDLTVSERDITMTELVEAFKANK